MLLVVNMHYADGFYPVRYGNIGKGVLKVSSEHEVQPRIYGSFPVSSIRISVWHFSATFLSVLAFIIPTVLYWLYIPLILCTIEKCIPHILLWCFYNSQKEQLPTASTQSPCSQAPERASVAEHQFLIMTIYSLNLNVYGTSFLFFFEHFFFFFFSLLKLLLVSETQHLTTSFTVYLSQTTDYLFPGVGDVQWYLKHSSVKMCLFHMSLSCQWVATGARLCCVLLPSHRLLQFVLVTDPNRLLWCVFKCNIEFCFCALSYFAHA